MLRATQRIIRTTQRIAVATGKAVKLGLRVTLASSGGLLMLSGLVLVHPLGLIILGIPIFALGFISAYKAVFW